MKYRKNKILIRAIIILALTFIAIIVLGIYPAVSAIISINREIIQQRLELERKLSWGLNNQKIKASLTNLESAIGQLDVIYLISGQELALINELDNLAIGSGVVSTLKPDFNGQNYLPQVKKIPLEINILSELPAAARFLRALELKPYYYNVDKIDLTATGLDNKINLQLIGQLFMEEKK